MDICLKKPIDITWIGRNFENKSIILVMKAVRISQMTPSHTLFVWASEDGETNINSYAYDYLDEKSKKEIDNVFALAHCVYEGI